MRLAVLIFVTRNGHFKEIAETRGGMYPIIVASGRSGDNSEPEMAGKNLESLLPAGKEWGSLIDLIPKQAVSSCYDVLNAGRGYAE